MQDADRIIDVRSSALRCIGLRAASVTNERGAFQIEPVPTGSYRVVVSVVGYASVSRRLEIVPETMTYHVDFRLPPSVVELGEIEVETESGPPRGWERDL